MQLLPSTGGLQPRDQSRPSGPFPGSCTGAKVEAGQGPEDRGHNLVRETWAWCACAVWGASGDVRICLCPFIPVCLNPHSSADLQSLPPSEYLATRLPVSPPSLLLIQGVTGGREQERGSHGGRGKRFNFQCWTQQFRLGGDKKAISCDGLLIQAASAFRGSLLPPCRAVSLEQPSTPSQPH